MPRNAQTRKLTFHGFSVAASSEHTACPECGSMAGNKVYQSVAATLFPIGGPVKGVGRIRRCYRCGHQWRTFEAAFSDLEPKLDFEPRGFAKLPKEIRTHFEYPPIPDRSHDWRAWYDWHDGDDEDAPQGWGETEIEAVIDLFQNTIDYEDGDGSEFNAIIDLAISAIQPKE